MGMFDAFGEQARLGQESPLQTIPVVPTLPTYMTPQNPTTTTTTAAPAKPIVRESGNKVGKFDADVVKAFTAQLATQAKGAQNIAQSATPTSLDQVLNPSREDYITNTKKSNVEKLSGGEGILGTKWKESWTPEGKSAYLNAKINRISQIAQLAGADENALSGIQQQAKYALSQVPQTGDDEADLTAAEGVLSQLEAQYAQGAIETAANGGEPVAAAEDIPGTYTPDEQAAIQVAIGQFMQPYADQAVLTGQNAANILNSTASSIQDPAYRAVVQQQAALAQQSGANTGLSIMKQAGVLPAIQALENQRQQAAQIQSLQNQLLQQQSQQTGTQDFGALLAQAGLGQ